MCAFFEYVFVFADNEMYLQIQKINYIERSEQYILLRKIIIYESLESSLKWWT
jgi:hypothetical protein